MTDGETHDDKGIAERRQRDFDDLQNELADRDVGRISRFFNEGEREAVKAARGKGDTTELLTNLQLLLQDPEYAALYERVGEKLREAEIAVERAIERAEARLAQEQAALDDMEQQAGKLPDGTPVFKDAQGRVWTADGREVGKTEADSVVWPGDAPSYEDYIAQREKAEAAQERRNELEGYQGRLGGYRDRYEDQNNPPSKDDLKGMEKDVDAVMDDVAERNHSADSKPDPTFDNTADLPLPPISG